MTERIAANQKPWLFQKGQSGNPAGRPKGALDKITQLQRKAALESGQSPLDYLLSIMRDENQSITVRLDAAKAAAPYLHPKLTAVEASLKTNEPIRVEVSWLD